MSLRCCYLCSQNQQGLLSFPQTTRLIPTDSLRDLGSPITDGTLVLKLMRGLSPRHVHLRAILTRITLFPSFVRVRDDLLLEELTTAVATTTNVAIALYSAKPRRAGPVDPYSCLRGVPPRQSAPPPPSVAPRPTTIPGSGRRRRKGGRGRGGGSGGPPATRGSGSWPSFSNPCTGSISMWPGLPAGHARTPLSLPSTLLHPHWRFRRPRHHLASSRVSCPHRPPPMHTRGALGVADGTHSLLLGPSAR
jgi:hypothetical protein